MEDKKIPSGTVRAWEAMGFVWDVLVMIAVPTVLFALAGRWLDRTLGVHPLFTILGLVLALILAGLLVYRKAKKLAAFLDETQNPHS